MQQQLTIGQLIDSKYRIVRMLGEGGMGTVYEGQNVRIGHRVAIKVLHSDLASRPDILERFEREAQAAGRIGSEHIVEVYDLGELPGGIRYMVMEYLDGENLAQRIERDGRMAPQNMGAIFTHVLEGIGAAHAAGIIHRDLKPENIFLVRDKKTGRDFAKLVDFGVSKFAVPQAGSMTRTGSVIGTPFYMSPEQAKGVKQTDHRADLYSIGVVLYECVTGRVPFHAETFNELMFKIVLEEAPDPATLVPDIDPRFAAIIRKAMARAPDDRYPDAATFQRHLEEWMQASGFLLSGTPVPLMSGQTPAPADRSHVVGPLGETAVQHPSAAGSLPAAASRLSKSGSLQGAASTAAPQSPKRTGPVVAAVAVGLALVVGAVAVSRRGGSAGHDPATNNPTPVQAAANATAAPDPTAAAAAATAAAVAPSSAPAVTAAASAAPEASAGTEVHVATAPARPTHAGGPVMKTASTPRPAAATAPAASSTAEQIKGRTIRTDL